MSPPISLTVKERVVQLHLEGKGRNEIAQILNSSHIRISQGSVTNILNAWKLEQDNSAPSQSHPETRPQEVSPRPLSPGQSQKHVPPSIENAKCQEHIPVPEYVKGHEGLVTSDEVNLGLVNTISIQDSKEKKTTHEEGQEVQDQSTEDQEQEESFMDSWWAMVFEQVMEAKKQRRDDLLLIEQKEKKLEQQRMQVDRARYNLEIREIKLLEAEPLISIARQLQDLGTDINQFLPWVETIHEKAQEENIPTLTEAAYSLAQDLRMYRQLGGLKKSIQLTTQQLEMLNISLRKQQQAIMTLVNLQSAGISESEIVELIGFVNQCGKDWRNGSNNNSNLNMIGISNSGCRANEFKFKLDDRLNV